MSREDPQMKIRLPADLKDQIEAAAKDTGRSMNAEIVARLESTFDPRELSQSEGEYSKLYRLRTELDALINREMLITMKLQMLKTELEQSKEAGIDEREKAAAQQMTHTHQDWELVRKRMDSLRLDIQDQQRKADDATREHLKILDSQIDRALQNEFMEVHKLEEELGVPKEKRTIVKNPSSNH